MKLLKIILEHKEYKPKDSGKAVFHTYSCLFMIKFLKKINKKDVIERIRGVKTVTIVEVKPSEKLDKINLNNKKFELSLLEIKFVTNIDPEKEIENIKFALVKSDKEKEIYNILGIVATTPKIDTLTKIS